MMLLFFVLCLSVVYSNPLIISGLESKLNGSSSTLLKVKNTNLKICNGDQVNFARYPYMVPLYNNNGGCFCSASILTKSNSDGVGVILTAGHCLGNSMRNGQVCVGCTHWTTPNNDPGHSFYNIDFYVFHPQYDAREIEYDVGLIYLTGPIIDRIGITSIPVDVCTSSMSMNDPLRIQGYGTTESPQAPGLVDGQTNFIDRQTCNQRYQDGGYNNWITESMQCMTNMGCCAAPQTDCYGDSGSPIMALGTNNAIGLVSWGIDAGGSGCCPTDYPSVIADLCLPSIKSWVLAG